MADTTPTPPVTPNSSAPAADKPPEKPQPKRSASAKAPVFTWYKVSHGAVGQWAQDRKINSDDLAGIDVDRLLRLNAIEVTTAPEEEAPPVAPDE